MNMKKVFPFLLLLVMAIVTIAIRRCNDNGSSTKIRNTGNRQEAPTRKTSSTTNSSQRQPGTNGGLDRNATKLFFTKHAKCRMKCRHITQQEVKDILANGEINYNKSDLQDARGATYAVEGITRDRQRVRIIFSPKQAHLTVVTVIDLEVEYTCNCT
jgi:hypothetical protein